MLALAVVISSFSAAVSMLVRQQAETPPSLAQGRAEAPVVITTMVTDLKSEQRRFFGSVALFEPNATIWVASTTKAAQEVKNAFPLLHIKTSVILDRYQGYSRGGLTRFKLWLPFQMEKARILRTALQAEGHTGSWYLDSDMFLLARLPRIDAPLGLSDHRIDPQIEAQYGKWNGGCVFVKSTEALSAWEQAAPHARSDCCEDQTALEDVARKFSGRFAEVGCGTDVGWYRFAAGTTKRAASHSRIQCVNGKVMYEGCHEEIRSFHYHVTDKEMRLYVEKALRDCHHPALPIVLASYPDPQSAPEGW